MFTEAFPIVSSPDLPRLLAFYTGALEARVTYQFPPEGEAVFVGLEIGASHLGLGADGALKTGLDGQRSALWVYADDCDAATARLVAAGATVVDPPTDQPWGERVAQLLDPDGNAIFVGQKGTTAEG